MCLCLSYFFALSRHTVVNCEKPFMFIMSTARLPCVFPVYVAFVVGIPCEQHFFGTFQGRTYLKLLMRVEVPLEPNRPNPTGLDYCQMIL